MWVWKIYIINIYLQLSAIPEFMAAFFLLSWIFSALTLVMAYFTFTVLKYYKSIRVSSVDAYNGHTCNENSSDVWISVSIYMLMYVASFETVNRHQFYQFTVGWQNWQNIFYEQPSLERAAIFYLHNNNLRLEERLGK